MTGEGKTIVLTGATSGVGYGAARRFARQGHALTLLCRSPGEPLAAELSQLGAARVDVIRCDLSSMASVREASEQILATVPRIDVLCSCAGVMPWRRSVTEEGNERVFATNVLGPALLTERLLVRLEASRGRVVMMGGDAHRYGRVRWDDPGLSSGYHALRAGTQAALLKTMWVLAMARALAAAGSSVTVNVFCPGPVKSALTRDFPRVLRPVMAIFDRFAQDPEQGSLTPVQLSLDERYAGQSGRYVRQGELCQPSAQARDEDAQDRVLALVRLRLTP